MWSTAVDEYLLEFLRNEISQRDLENVASWQQMLCGLIDFMLRQGMPMHKLDLSSYKEMTVQALNAEEALLAALSSCALATEKLSQIDWPNDEAFGAWFSRLNGWPRGAGQLAKRCLNRLNLWGQNLSLADLGEADLVAASLGRANLVGADLSVANLAGADLGGANLRVADLVAANLSGANLQNADLQWADLGGAQLHEANLQGANFSRARWIDGEMCGKDSIGGCRQQQNAENHFFEFGDT